MRHVLPLMRVFSTSSISTAHQKDYIDQITDQYFGIIVIPIRKAVVLNFLGPDIGPIVLSFLPTDDKYEHKYKNVQLVTNVV